MQLLTHEHKTAETWNHAESLELSQPEAAVTLRMHARNLIANSARYAEADQTNKRRFSLLTRTLHANHLVSDTTELIFPIRKENGRINNSAQSFVWIEGSVLATHV